RSISDVARAAARRESGTALPHSRTLPRQSGMPLFPRGPGVRQCCAALEPARLINHRSNRPKAGKNGAFFGNNGAKAARVGAFLMENGALSTNNGAFFGKDGALSANNGTKATDNGARAIINETKATVGRALSLVVGAFPVGTDEKAVPTRDTRSH